LSSCRILSNPGSLEIINQLAFGGQIYIWHLPTSQSGSKQNGNSASITWLPKHTCTTRAGRNWVAESEGFLGVAQRSQQPNGSRKKCSKMLQSPTKNTHNERKREKERERERDIYFGLYNHYIIRFCPYSLHSKPIITSHRSLKVQKNLLFPLEDRLSPLKKVMAPWKTPSKIGKQKNYSSEKVNILSSKVAMVQMVHLISSELIHLSYRWCSFRKPSPEGRASATSPYLISICVTILVPRLTLW